MNNSLYEYLLNAIEFDNFEEVENNTELKDDPYLLSNNTKEIN